jgi:trans-aconitate methyltransferase
VSSLERSWGAFSDQRAEEYLTTGASSPESRDIVVDILLSLSRGRKLAVLDLGCGNGATYRYLVERKVQMTYTGVDFSEPLLEAARRSGPEATFLRDDVEKLEAVSGPFDVVLYSHVLEMLGSPQASLERAAQLAPTIILRFFEPPEHAIDLVELLEMDVGGRSVPYLRRTMSRDYYRLLLARVDAKTVDVYRCESSKDQVHVVGVAWPRS